MAFEFTLRPGVSHHRALAAAALCLPVLLLSPDRAAYAIPPNAYAVSGGVGWRCSTGYQRVASGCQKIGGVARPANAAGQGGHWYCKSGYRKEGNQCRKVDLPASSYNSGNQWSCQVGYYRQGNRCEKLDTPATVTTPALEERCDGGYILVGDVCRMNVPDRPSLGD